MAEIVATASADCKVSANVTSCISLAVRVMADQVRTFTRLYRVRILISFFLCRIDVTLDRFIRANG